MTIMYLFGSAFRGGLPITFTWILDGFPCMLDHEVSGVVDGLKLNTEVSILQGQRILE